MVAYHRSDIQSTQGRIFQQLFGFLQARFGDDLGKIDPFAAADQAADVRGTEMKPIRQKIKGQILLIMLADIRNDLICCHIEMADRLFLLRLKNRSHDGSCAVPQLFLRMRVKQLLEQIHPKALLKHFRRRDFLRLLQHIEDF